MHEDGFRLFLKKLGKPEATIKTCVSNAETFEQYLSGAGKHIGNATMQDLEKFAESEHHDKNVSKFMWALAYYFEFTRKTALLQKAKEIRAAHLSLRMKPFFLKDFMDLSQSIISKLEDAGIRNTEQVLASGRTKRMRKDLSDRTGLTLDSILEVVRLSDLSRLPGVKGVRARLYHDSGLYSVKLIAETQPERILEITRRYVQEKGFSGIAPLPTEVESTCRNARNLPNIVEW
jgi:hypothetical protein